MLLFGGIDLWAIVLLFRYCIDKRKFFKRKIRNKIV